MRRSAVITELNDCQKAMARYVELSGRSRRSGSWKHEAHSRQYVATDGDPAKLAAHLSAASNIFQASPAISPCPLSAISRPSSDIWPGPIIDRPAG